MLVRVDSTWREASRPDFRPDDIRRKINQNGRRFRAAKNEVVVQKQYEQSTGEIKNWFNERPDVTNYMMSSVFNVTNDGIFFHGLAFKFQSDDDALMFRLSFSVATNL